MSDLEKPYDPSLVEDKLYAKWQKEGLFTADAKSERPSYTIILPPPNVTGVLHMGHGLVNTLQDILIRWKRMSGYEVAWIPGTDHAGISTQSVVEKHLFSKTGKRRSDFDRDEFLGHVWSWKEEHEEKILNQLKRLGSSLDWSRQRFTMDETSTKSVKTCFKKMFDEKLIYRGDYLVNWDPVLQTAIADDEVEYEEEESHLWHIKYPIEGTNESVVVATTRPETMLGDTAVAVSPGDERYAKFVGKNIRLPITNRLVKIVEDRYVDKDFGTGVVKITPAHDPNDYEIGVRHDLEMINIMNPDATVNENGGEFKGMTMADARIAVVEKLKELGALVKIEPHNHRIGLSYRSKAKIQPYLSKQWYVNMGPFKEKLLSCVRDGKLEIVPQGWDKTYNHWIDNLRDWCISRQLWWGHRIPVWYHVDDPERVICYIEDGVPDEVKADPDSWVQEDDVLDTWFSSALWPMTTLGWPEKTPDFEKFYPNSTLITGHDILFFWVARMIAMGEYITGELPFPQTFIHGLIYGKSYWRTGKDGNIHYVDAEERLSFEMGTPVPKDVKSKWEKMSKSKGNVIDPIEIIDMYGADAMRFALASSTTHARQIDLDRRKFEEFKHFANKIWNSARFVISNIEASQDSDLPALTVEDLYSGLDRDKLRLEDRWILSRLNRTVKAFNANLDKYVFNEAAMGVYSFFWDDFCAYYLELCKPYLYGKAGTPEDRTIKQMILLTVFLSSIRLMHPIAPFITEELFGITKGLFPTLEKSGNIDPYTDDLIESLTKNSIMIAPFPQVLIEEDMDEGVERDFGIVNDVIYSIRNIRAEMQIPLATKTDVHIVAKPGPLKDLIEREREMVYSLVRVQNLSVHEREPKLASASTAIVKDLKILIPLPAELNEKEKARLKKGLEKATAQISQHQGMLDNKSYIEKAPEALVNKTKGLLEDALSKKTEIEKKLEELL